MTTMLLSNSNPVSGDRHLRTSVATAADHKPSICGSKGQLSTIPTAPSSYDDDDDDDHHPLQLDNSTDIILTYPSFSHDTTKKDTTPKKLAMDRLVKVSQLLRQGKALHNNRSNHRACLALLRLNFQQRQELQRRQEIQQQQQKLLQQLREIQKQQQPPTTTTTNIKDNNPSTTSTTRRRRVHFDASLNDQSDPTNDLDVDFDVCVFTYDRVDPEFDRPYVWWARHDYVDFFDRDEADFQCVYNDMTHTKNMLQLWGACSRDGSHHNNNNVEEWLRKVLVDTDRDLAPPGAGAWGLEYRIVTEIRNHRNKAVQAFLKEYQQNKEKGENDALCPCYLKFSQTAQRFAQALARGNASYVQEFVCNQEEEDGAYNGDHHRYDDEDDDDDDDDDVAA